MKKNIKYLFALLLIPFSLTTCINQAMAQKLEIVILGSSHENPPGSDDFKKIIVRLKNFHPDMVFGEYLSPEDYNSLDKDNWAYTGFKKSKDFIARHQHPAKNIKSHKSSDLYKSKMDQAAYYVIQGDRANAEYQFYILEHHMKKNFGKEDLAYYEQRFGSLDSIKKAGLYRPLSEYTNIFFPLLHELKQDKIYPMDCQKYDKEWSVQSAGADSAYRILAKKAMADTGSEEAKTLAAINKYQSITDDDKKMMSLSDYENMAQTRYAELNDAWNFYGGSHFYGYAGFPDQFIKGMYTQWGLRNSEMCANVLKRVKANKARRIVIGAGAAHRRIMEDILAKDPDVKIISYNNL